MAGTQAVKSYDKLFIDGEWVEPAGSGTIEVVNPSTEEAVATVPDATPADVDRAVAAARRAFDDGPWPRMSPGERADVMAAVSQGIQARLDEMATVISTENGSPISWSLMGQALSSTMILDYFTGLAREYAFEETRQGMMGPVLVRREPVGVAGAITPWNVPLFTTMLKFAPAMAAGATMVVKPAPETPLDAFLLAEIAAEAGLPPGVLNVVPAGREVGEHLVTHPGIDKIGFTGSTAAGKRIASLCGERLRRVTLELGGKSAAILMADADPAQVVPELMLNASMMNNGEACVAQTRLLAPRDRYREWVEAIAEHVGTFTVGDALDAGTQVGPLVSQRQRERVEGYIRIGQEEGAKVAVGGGRPGGLDRGWFVEPTVFVDVDNSMRIAQEEIFGPVVAVIPYDDEEQAVAIANDSVYGLSGSVWGPDVERAADIARRVRTGTLSINTFMLEFSCPFGGFKESGVGRELGPEGLEAYLEAKSIQLPMA